MILTFLVASYWRVSGLEFQLEHGSVRHYSDVVRFCYTLFQLLRACLSRIRGEWLEYRHGSEYY